MFRSCRPGRKSSGDKYLNESVQNPKGIIDAAASAMMSHAQNEMLNVAGQMAGCALNELSKRFEQCISKKVFYQGLEKKLPRPAPGHAPILTKLRNEEFADIAEWCRLYGEPEWYIRPRTFVVLYMIDHLGAMDGFAKEQLTDYALPYSAANLPATVKGRTARERFLKYQSLVLTAQQADLETEGSGHQNIEGSADQYFVQVRELGKGHFGTVDHVVSNLSIAPYARKRMSRGFTFDQNRQTMKFFVNELEVMKRLSHRHLVKFVGSYTDQHCVGFIMTPVADCNLRHFMDSNMNHEQKKQQLRGFFGCLSIALEYLHRQRVRHKDIKPENILVHQGNVLLTDFGTSHAWADDARSYTTGTVQAFTLRYCAPEVARQETRNEQADIWSLGCVFFELVTVLGDRSFKDMQAFFASNGTCNKFIRDNQAAFNLWAKELEGAFSHTDDRHPLALTRKMCIMDQDERPTAPEIVSDIWDFDVKSLYYNLCCQRRRNHSPLGLEEVPEIKQVAVDEPRSKLPKVSDPNFSLAAMLPSNSYQSPFVEDTEESTLRNVFPEPHELNGISEEPSSSEPRVLDMAANSIPSVTITGDPDSETITMHDEPQAQISGPIILPDPRYMEQQNVEMQDKSATSKINCSWPGCTQTHSNNPYEFATISSFRIHLRQVHGVHDFGNSILLVDGEGDEEGNPSAEALAASAIGDPYTEKIKSAILERRNHVTPSSVQSLKPSAARKSSIKVPKKAIEQESSSKRERNRSDERKSVRFDLLPDENRPGPTDTSLVKMDQKLEDTIRNSSTLPESSLSPSHILASMNRFTKQELDLMLPRSKTLSFVQPPLFVYGTFMFPSVVKAQALHYMSKDGRYSSALQKRLFTDASDWSNMNMSLQHVAERMTPALLEGDYFVGKPRHYQCAALLPKPLKIEARPLKTGPVQGFLLFGLSRDAMQCLDQLFGSLSGFSEYTIQKQSQGQNQSRNQGQDQNESQQSDDEGVVMSEYNASGNQKFFKCDQIRVQVTDQDGETRQIRALTYVWTGGAHSLDHAWSTDEFLRSGAFTKLAHARGDATDWLEEESQLAKRMGVRFTLPGDDLCDAALKADRDKIRDLVDQGHSVHATCQDYGSVLQAAASAGDVKTVELLLRREALINEQGGRYGTPLIAAITEDHEHIVSCLIDNGANVIAKGGRNVNALYQAVNFSKYSMVNLLLEHGAWLSNDYDEIMDLAAERGDRRVSDILKFFDVRAKPKAKKDGEDTPSGSSSKRSRLVRDTSDGSTDSDDSATLVEGSSNRSRRSNRRGDEVSSKKSSSARAIEATKKQSAQAYDLLRRIGIEYFRVKGQAGEWTGSKAIRIIRVVFPNGMSEKLMEDMRPHLGGFRSLVDFLKLAMADQASRSPFETITARNMIEAFNSASPNASANARGTSERRPSVDRRR